MTPIEKLGLAVLHRVDPERAHGLSLVALRTGLAPLPGVVTSARLATSVAGLALPNPVGLAAGFDKNATALGALVRAGFGFVEVGASTPLAQPGNAKARLFRLSEDRADEFFGLRLNQIVALAAVVIGLVVLAWMRRHPIAEPVVDGADGGLDESDDEDLSTVASDEGDGDDDVSPTEV